MASQTADSVRVLLVDDEQEVAELTAAFLERTGEFDVEIAMSADEGRQRLDANPPDCVVSDYNMPGEDGIEFLEATRERYPELPFILFTGQGSETVASDAISAGVTDYLRKGTGADRYELLANRIRNAVESRRNERRAVRQEELMRLTEFAGDTGGWELDVRTDTFLLTDGLCRLLGLDDRTQLPRAELLGFVHPEDRDEVEHTLEQVAETGERDHGTWRHHTVDGDQRVMDVTVTPATEDGSVRLLRGAMRDITEQRERRRELDLLRQAVDDAGVAIALTDPGREDNPLVYVNDEFQNVTGYDAEAVLGRNCRFLQGEGTDPAKTEAVREAIRNEESVTVELRNYRKDGTEFWNRLTVAPIYDETGALVRYLGTQEDVTERKEREQELQRYKRMVNSMQEAACIYDADARFEVVNEYLAEFYGTTQAALVGQESSLIERLRADADGDPYQELLDGTRAEIRDEIEAEFPDRGVEVLSFRLTPLRIDGEIDGVVGVAHEVTDHRERERELKEKNERLDEFASIVSHDLRNPLNVASGYTELAREASDSEHLQRISEAHERMERLIDELLTLARSGTVVTDTEPVEIPTAARNAWKHVSTATATLVVEADRRISADRSRLEQLLENLFRNAVEHSSTSSRPAADDAGEHGVTNGQPETDGDPEDGVTVTVGPLPDGFYVADDGPGIDPSEREAVFDAGYSTSESGTGFGLNIVQEIATAHEWEITLTESEAGGARFELTDVTSV